MQLCDGGCALALLTRQLAVRRGGHSDALRRAPAAEEARTRARSRRRWLARSKGGGVDVGRVITPTQFSMMAPDARRFTAGHLVDALFRRILMTNEILLMRWRSTTTSEPAQIYRMSSGRRVNYKTKRGRHIWAHYTICETAPSWPTVLKEMILSSRIRQGIRQYLYLFLGSICESHAASAWI